jgi:integrase
VKPEVSPVTHDCYTKFVNHYLARAFGNVPLAKLSPHIIQAKYSEWAEGGRHDGKPGPLAVKSRRLLHDVLSSALTRAVELQLISRNPAQVLRRRLPKNEHLEMATLTPEQVRRVQEAVRGMPHYWPILLSLATGARRGEVCALLWRYIDLERGHIRIVESLKQTSRGIVRGLPKSTRSRVVTLPSSTIEELRQWKRGQAEQLLRVGMRQGPDTAVCTQPDGALIGPDVLTSFYRRLAKRLGLPTRFHSLRHTHATALLSAGVHPRVAQERLGHSNVAVTMNVYSHVTERLQDDAAVKIEDVFWRSR